MGVNCDFCERPGIVSASTKDKLSLTVCEELKTGVGLLVGVLKGMEDEKTLTHAFEAEDRLTEEQMDWLYEHCGIDDNDPNCPPFPGCTCTVVCPCRRN